MIAGPDRGDRSQAPIVGHDHLRSWPRSLPIDRRPRSWSRSQSPIVATIGHCDRGHDRGPDRGPRSQHRGPEGPQSWPRSQASIAGTDCGGSWPRSQPIVATITGPDYCPIAGPFHINEFEFHHQHVFLVGREGRMRAVTCLAYCVFKLAGIFGSASILLPPASVSRSW